MRTTLNVDDDVLAFARAHARHEHISIGEAVSRLVREGIRVRNGEPATLREPESRYALLPPRDEVITPEHVRSLMDEEGI